MSDGVPRLRMFAGPNGSGKSVIKQIVPEELLGIYLNPDDLEAKARRSGRIDLRSYGTTCSEDQLRRFLRSSTLLAKGNLIEEAERLQFVNGTVLFNSVEMNSYFASVLVDFVRRQLIDNRATVSFETVMSFRDKVDVLSVAREAGYRTYLYYVATNNPDINVERVAERVRRGGHDVPEDKIRSRYVRSLDLLHDAIRQTSRAYIFDNSGDELIWLAEVTDGRLLEQKTNTAPAWFKRAVIDKIPTKDLP